MHTRLHTKTGVDPLSVSRASPALEFRIGLPQSAKIHRGKCPELAEEQPLTRNNTYNNYSLAFRLIGSSTRIPRSSTKGLIFLLMQRATILNLTSPCAVYGIRVRLDGCRPDHALRHLTTVRDS